MNDKEIMVLAKDIVMYFDGLEMCSETPDVLVEMIISTYEQIKNGKGAEIIDELGSRAEDICSEILEAKNNYFRIKKYWNSWQSELTVVHDLQERIWKVVYGND